MVKITLRQKIALELYSNLSLLSAILILLFYIFSGRIGTKFFILIIGIILFFSIVFVYFLRTLIRDVNSAEYYEDIEKDKPSVEDIKGINKITFEIFSTLSNIVIIAAIVIFGISETEGPLSELLSFIFIILFSIPIIISIKFIIFDLNIILNKKDRVDNFFAELFSKKTFVLLLIFFLIAVFLYSGNNLFTSITKASEKSMVISGVTTTDISTKIFMTKIFGEKTDIRNAPITSLYLHVETTEMIFYINSISINFINETTTSKLEYGFKADGSHFSYEGKNIETDKAILEAGETGIITINLSSTGQELYSNKNGTIQLIMANGKIITKDIKTPELKEETLIQLYSK